ncbi:MAG: protein-L-isoaspartate O-methyltransferase [Chrysiogenales bacterium]|nr:MAG: protein-L-isoaspartate O-methyltransferase [Chrysiogenales bacterium]
MATGREKSKYLNALKSAGAAKKLLDAFAGVDRNKFFDPIFAERVYSMEPIPIGSGQKSETPLILAKMIGHLPIRKKGRVLEVGTGSGYSTAVLSHIARELVTVEYHEDLARMAKERLLGGGYSVSRFFSGDATDFDEPLGEFDAVIVFAACMRTPYFLINALRPGGVAVFPMGPAHQQQIARYVNDSDARRSADNFRFFDFCTFDSIRGVYGWVDVPDVPLHDDADPGNEE